MTQGKGIYIFLGGGDTPNLIKKEREKRRETITTQEKTTQHKTPQDNRTYYKEKQDKTRQSKTRQSNTLEDKMK
jgi:hypothetical protein